MNHTDSNILHVILCPGCLLPMCEHGHCINLGECPKANATLCRCYVIYGYAYERNQDLIGDARCNGKRRGKRKREESAA